MSYEKQIWVDKVTPVDSEHLNHMEDGIDTLSKEIAAIKNGDSLTTVYEYSLAIGSAQVAGGIYPGSTTRATTEGILTVDKGTIVESSVLSTYQFSVFFYDESIKKESETGWLSVATYTITSDSRIKIQFGRFDNAVMTDDDLDAIKAGVRVYHKEKGEADIEAEEIRNDIIRSINIEYGRSDGASWQFVRIPKETNDGRTIRPVVRLTSEDGSLTGEKCSAIAYAEREKTAFVINAGLFDVANKVPLGQTIVDGVSVVNEPHPQGANNETISDTECYPLCIDGDGVLSAPYDRYVDTATMIADGITQACCGWIKIVEDYDILTEEIQTEIVHPQEYNQQIIGQFFTGDYCVLTVSKSGYQGSDPNDAGLTYTQCAQLLVDKGVKFAYALDGGGSTQTVVGKRLINPKHDGRRLPAVIVFKAID